MTGFFAGEDLSPNRIELARREAQAGAGYIDLTSSNPTHQGLLFPPALLQEAAQPYWTNRRYQPDAHGSLTARTAIAEYYKYRTPALHIRPEELFVTASTSEAYSLLFALLTEPGDNILAPAVSYPLFDYLAAIHHVQLRPYALDETRDWRIDPASLHAQADSLTRAVLVISPHNPTGTIIQTSVPSLTGLGLPVICDEVFAEFTTQGQPAPPFGALHPLLPVFHLNGISKMFALPDLKLGWIAPSGGATEIYAERLEFLNDTFLGANSLTQSMLPALFERGMPFVAEMREYVRSNLALALTKLAACPAVHARPPDGGYYLFPAVDGWDDEEELVVHLLKHGVLVHPGYFYGYEHGTHLMISCLTNPSDLNEGLDRLIAALSE
jgi:aspartate/methionine/tyrosine aminotransferase